MPLPESLREPPELPELTFPSEPPAGASAVVAFIHCLGGHYYETWGPKGQPAAFMRRLSRDLPDVALATYGYQKAAKLHRVWATVIRDRLLGDYRAVAIICHRIGGLLTIGALRHLFTTQDDVAEQLREGRKTLSLFLMGVPLSGMKRSAASLWQEKRAFSERSTFVHENLVFWRNHVRGSEGSRRQRRVPLAAYAVVPEDDRSVPQLATDDLPEGNISRSLLTTAQIVQPPLVGDFDPYDFVRERLASEFSGTDLPLAIRQRIPRVETSRKIVLLASQTDQYVDRPWLTARIDELVGLSTSGYIHLTGEEGLGKSTYLSRLVSERDLPSHAFSTECGVTEAGALGEAIWCQLIARELLKPGAGFDEPPLDAVDLFRHLEAAVENSKGPLIIVVDALDEAEGSLPLPPRLPDGVFLITSSGSDRRMKDDAEPVGLSAADDHCRDDVRRYLELRVQDRSTALRLKTYGWQPEEVVDVVLSHASGSFGDAVSLLEELSLGRKRRADLQGPRAEIVVDDEVWELLARQLDDQFLGKGVGLDQIDFLPEELRRELEGKEVRHHLDTLISALKHTDLFGRDPLVLTALRRVGAIEDSRFGRLLTSAADDLARRLDSWKARDPFDDLTVSYEPFIDRQELRDGLRALLGRQLVFRVTGDRQTGKSYSQRLIRWVRGSAGVRTVFLGPDDGVTWKKFLSNLAKKMDVNPDRLFASEGKVDREKRIRGACTVLVEEAQGSGHRWWVVVDDFRTQPGGSYSSPTESYQQEYSEVVDCIAALTLRIWQTEPDSPMRLVLLDYNGRLPRETRSRIGEEELHELTERDIRRYFVDFFASDPQREQKRRAHDTSIPALVSETLDSVAQKKRSLQKDESFMRLLNEEISRVTASFEPSQPESRRPKGAS